MKKQLLSIMTSGLILVGIQQSNAQMGASLNFDGTNDYVTTTNNITHGNHFTYEAWINLIAPQDWGGIMTTNTSSGQNQWVQFTLTGGGVLRAEVVDDAGNNKWYDGTTVLTGAWHHVAITFDGTNLLFYVDGNTEPISTMVSNATLGAITLNSKLQFAVERSLGPHSNIIIDEARVWNIARTQTQIQNYMNCSVTDTASGLVAYYGFNEAPANGSNASFTTLHDVTGHGYNGTLTNFALTGASSNYVADARLNYFGLQSSIGSLSNADRLGNGVAADFNGDGYNDIIVVDDAANTRLYLNGGKGNFANTYTTITTGGGGNYCAADIDNDGDIDFTCANGSANVKVFINNGLAVFTPITITFNGTGSSSITKIADVNGDGKMDVIIGNGSTGATDQTEVWLNTGTTGSAAFTFAAGLDNSTGGKNSIAIGDIDGDGDKDIITGSSSNGAELFLNNANNGTFTQGTAPGGYSGGVMLVDWDQDGILDYMNFDSYNNYGLRWRKGDGAGNFASTAIILAQTGVSNHAYLGDLNGDGFLDAVLDHWGGDAFVFLSNGCSLTQQNGCNYTLGRSDNGNAIADFNGDGSLDIFCGARNEFSSFWMNYVTPVTTPALPTISVSNGIIYAGQSYTINPSGATTYTFSSGSAVVSPTVTTVYIVTGANVNGCTSMKNDTVFVKGAALNFNGTNNTIDLGMGITNALVGGNQLTVEAWVAPTNTLSAGTIVNNHQNTTQFLLGRNTNTYYFFIGFGAFSVATPTIVVANTWQHVAGVYDGSSLKIYVNGVLSGTTAVSSFSFPTSSTSVKLGSDAFGEYFNGSMDEVRIWSRALCQGEIQNNMNAEVKLPQIGLLAYYKFNEGIGNGNNPTVTTLLDSSGNGYNGTLANFALNGNTSNWVAPGAVNTFSYSPAFAGPTITVNSPSICAGNTATLTASGVTTYTWNTSATTATITATPTVTTNYMVTGADANNCMASATATVTVNSLPIVMATVTSATVCVGVKDTLSAMGANTYTWSTNAGSATSMSVAVTQTVNATYNYTVTGTDANGCVNTNTVSVIANTCSTGINNVASSNAVNIYPNPSNGNFEIRTTANAKAIMVTDMLGNILLSIVPNGTNTNVQLSAQPNGFYLIKVINADGSQTVKRITINN